VPVERVEVLVHLVGAVVYEAAPIECGASVIVSNVEYEMWAHDVLGDGHITCAYGCEPGARLA
jgi:hypothetical protein